MPCQIHTKNLAWSIRTFPHSWQYQYVFCFTSFVRAILPSREYCESIFKFEHEKRNYLGWGQRASRSGGWTSWIRFIWERPSDISLQHGWTIFFACMVIGDTSILSCNKLVAKIFQFLQKSMCSVTSASRNSVPQCLPLISFPLGTPSPWQIATVTTTKTFHISSNKGVNFFIVQADLLLFCN